MTRERNEHELQISDYNVRKYFRPGRNVPRLKCHRAKMYHAEMSGYRNVSGPKRSGVEMSQAEMSLDVPGRKCDGTELSRDQTVSGPK